MSIFSIFKKKEVFETLPADWLEEGLATHSPDISFLERREYQRVFVCDELMKAHWSHKLLGQEVIRPNVVPITQDKFSLLKKKRGNVSVVIPLQERYADVPYTHIRGELYGIQSKHFIELDRDKANGVEFQRIRVRLHIPYHKLSKHWWAKERDEYEKAKAETTFWEDGLNAWMYVGVQDYWEPIMTKTWDYSKGYEGCSFLKTTYRRDPETGQFLKKIRNKAYTPVKAFTPNNRRLEKYYYHSTFHQFDDN